MLNVTVYFVAGAEHPWFDLGVHVDPSNFILAGISAMADSSSSPAQHSSVTRDHETKGRELDLVQKLHHIPSPPTGDVSCCCGCRDCDFVKHTSEMLNTAAEALLVRHEAYVVEAEEGRSRMDATIRTLEAEKRTLQMENVKSIDENRSLLDQLEEMNTSIGDSEAEQESLKSKLLSTQQELHRVAMMAARTMRLEMELETMEQEHDQLHQALIAAQGHERRATQKWRKAERSMGHLQEELERLELEAAEEREENAETVARLERVQGMAAGRRSSSKRRRSGSRSREPDDTKEGGAVISNFMQGVLQDNMKLHTDISELRGMLINAHDETDRLRDHILLHQEIPAHDGSISRPATQGHELAAELARALGQPAGAEPDEVSGQSSGSVTVSPEATPQPHLDAVALSIQLPALHPRRPPYADWLSLNRKSSRAASVSQGQQLGSPQPSTLDTLQRRSSHSTNTTTTNSASTALSSVSNTPLSARRFPTMSDKAMADKILESRSTSPESCRSMLEPPTPYSATDDGWCRRDPTGLATSRTPLGSTPFTNTILPPSTANENASASRRTALGIDFDARSLHTSSRTAENHDLASSHQHAVPGNRPFVATSTDPLLRRVASHESLLSVSALNIPGDGAPASQRLVRRKGFLPRMGPRPAIPSAGSVSSHRALGAMSSRGAVSSLQPKKGNGSSAVNRSLLQSSQRSIGAGGGLLPVVVPIKDVFGMKLGDWTWSMWGTKVPGSSQAKQERADLPSKAAAPPMRPIDAMGKLKASREASGVVATEVNVTLLQEALSE